MLMTTTSSAPGKQLHLRLAVPLPLPWCALYGALFVPIAQQSAADDDEKHAVEGDLGSESLGSVSCLRRGLRVCCRLYSPACVRCIP